MAFAINLINLIINILCYKSNITYFIPLPFFARARASSNSQVFNIAITYKYYGSAIPYPPPLPLSPSFARPLPHSLSIPSSHVLHSNEAVLKIREE